MNIHTRLSSACCLSLAALCAVLATTGCAIDRQAIALERLRAESATRPVVQFENGAVRFLTGRLSLPAGQGADPVEAAYRFLDGHRDLYRLADPRASLHPLRVVRDEAGAHVFFGQHQDQIPVFASELAVHLSGDAVVATNGRYLNRQAPAPAPAVSGPQAEALAATDLARPSQPIGDTKLTHFNASLFMAEAEMSVAGSDALTHLAWRTRRVETDQHATHTYFIDAMTGRVLLHLEDTLTHAAAKDFNIRTANNQGETLFCGFVRPTLWFDENGPVAGATPDAEGQTMFDASHLIYDYFYNRFHRHSWNGNDGTNWYILDVRRTQPNASFVPACGHFVFSPDMAVVDVAAHEYTHGITRETADLIYANQSGALNESYSDYFAMMVDPANWTIGEGLPPGVGSRNIEDPTLSGQPDRMATFLFTTADSGGVHTNSGIPNKVGFLVTQGGTHQGIAVNGLGRLKASQLYWDVLTTWLPAMPASTTPETSPWPQPPSPRAWAETA